MNICEQKQFLKQLCIPSTELNVLNAIKKYDTNTYTHCIDVAMLTKQFMEHLHYSKKSVRTGTIAALIHDAGKIGTPYEIINKPGALTNIERELVNKHTINAPLFMRGCNDLELLVATTHHKHYSEIDELTQIVAICDVYSANHLERAYKPMNAPKTALNNTLGAKTLNPELLYEFKKMWLKTPEMMQDSGTYIKPESSYYESKSLSYIASKYHISENQLYIQHNPNGIIFNKETICTLNENGTICSEPYEMKYLPNWGGIDSELIRS